MVTYEDHFWVMANSGVRVGESDSRAFTYKHDEQAVWLGEGVYSIMDTSAQDIMISTIWYETLMDEIFKGILDSYFLINGKPYTNCGNDLPNLYFDFDGKTLQVRAEDYVEPDWNGGTFGVLCRLRISPLDAPFNIFGVPLYLGYYVTHNYSESNQESGLTF